jgi:glucose-1-phosphatase
MVDKQNNDAQQAPASFDPCEQRRRRIDVSIDGIEPGTEFKVLAFDIGKVLVPFDWPAVEAGFARRTNSSLRQVSEAMLKLQKLGYESGGINTAGFLQELNRLLCSDITREEFTALWNESFTECQLMIPVVEQLAKTHRLIALSNTNEEHFEHLDKTLNIYRHFEHLIVSHKVGFMKPHKRIFQEVKKYTGRSVLKREVLFIDDKPAFVHGARQYGLRAIQFTTPEAFVERLRQIGLLL